MVNKDVPLCDLFQLYRFGSGLEMFFLIFYTPIGLVLAIFRFFLALQLLLVLLVLKKTWLFTRLLLKVCCTVLGIVVTSEGKEYLERERIKIIISNNVTILDNVAMEIVAPCIMQENRSGCLWFIERWLQNGTGGVEIRQVDLEEKVPGILAADPSISFLALPEEATTSSKSAGLLKFSTWPFGISDTVIPAVITANRLPFPPVHHTVFRSHWLSELFWFFFVPYTHFHIRFLPSVTKQEDETQEQFCQNIEKDIACTLGVRTTSYTSINKAVLEIKLRRVEELSSQSQNQTRASTSSSSTRPTQPQTSNSPGQDTRLNKMASQVKEVLPQVPLVAIKKDLATTRCVDTTITNVIEGRVSYIPEDSTQKPSNSIKPSTSKSPSPPKASNAAASFSPSSEKRQQSFEERKRNMIEEARRRYIAKNGL